MRPTHPLLRATVAVAVVALAAATVNASEAPAPRLAPTFASLDEMAAAVSEALAARDLDRLRHLAVTADEFRDVVWPELDAARPERRLTWDFVWSQHRLRHERGLARAIGMYGDRDLTITSVTFREQPRDYPSFRLHRSSVVALAGPDGSAVEAELFASVIELGGRFKIYSFITD